jgi:cytochrome c peroxidase
LRSILSGYSLHDRAEEARRARKGEDLEAQDYELALTDDMWKRLQPEEESKSAVARQLLQGYTLFHGKANCSRCHSGFNYSDSSFHNLGVGDSSRDFPPGEERGRYASLSGPNRDRRMIGAYKTPSLRSVPLQGPYFHDGSLLLPGDPKLQGPLDSLFQVIVYHTREFRRNAHLDPLIQPIDLKEGEVRALALFLRALQGDPVPDLVAEAPGAPEKLAFPKK